MKRAMKWVVLLVALFPCVATAQGVKPGVFQPEVTLWSAWANGTLGASNTYGGRTIGRPFVLTKVVGLCQVAGGGGAGDTVLTLTDGTNTCTATISCAATAAGQNCGNVPTGVKTFTIANGSGSGCAFPSGATIGVSVTTAGCTTTQPNFRNLEFIGRWK